MGRVDSGDAGPPSDGRMAVLARMLRRPPSTGVADLELAPLVAPKQSTARRIPRHLVGTAPSDAGTLVVAPEGEQALARMELMAKLLRGRR